MCDNAATDSSQRGGRYCTETEYHVHQPDRRPTDVVEMTYFIRHKHSASGFYGRPSGCTGAAGTPYGLGVGMKVCDSFQPPSAHLRLRGRALYHVQHRALYSTDTTGDRILGEFQSYST